MPLATEQDHTPEEAAILKLVRDRKELSERARKPFIPRWKEWYGLHRNVSRYSTAVRGASERDRDSVVGDGKREFGAELFVPMIFTTVESVVPRALSNDPTMKVRPRYEDLDQQKADAVRQLYADRQSEIGYSLRLQPVARQGFKYGLGIQKTRLEEKTRSRISIEPGILGGRVQKQVEVTTHGPISDFVDIWDGFWDPVARDMETSRYFLHRIWLDYQAIEERVKTGKWRSDLDLEAVSKMGSEGDHGSMLAERADAMGLKDFDTNLGRLHEVWEYHDGENVYTVLDKALLVQEAANPFTHRELPFQIFRPTLDETGFVGIGEIEPIVDLQYELNTLRSQRRDNATFVLQKAFLYAKGLVDPEDFVVGPGMGIGVDGGVIDDVIKPLVFGDIPASGYQEERAIKDDINLASGISESVAGAGTDSADQTATGIQLVQAAANIRIQNKTKMLRWELIKPGASQWLEIFRMLAATEPITFPVESVNGYQMVTVSAEDLDLVAAVIPEDGSTEPDNPPQRKNDALALWNQVNGNPVVDQRKAVLHLLRANDVSDADDWVLPEQPVANPEVANEFGHAFADTLIQSGMDPKQAEDLALQAVQEAMQQTGVSEPTDQQASQNGAPQPAGAPQ